MSKPDFNRIFVSSDFHLYHRAIHKFCPGRHHLSPADDLDLMARRIIDAHIEAMPPGSDFIFLGDLSFQIGTKKWEVFDEVARLRMHLRTPVLADDGYPKPLGKMTWIVGNHDEPERMPDVASLFDEVVDAKYFKGERDVRSHVFLSHYPLSIPPEDGARLVSIHGHNHGSYRAGPGTLDVGIDSLYGLHRQDSIAVHPDYTCQPITLQQAINLAQLDFPAPYVRDPDPIDH